jgi:hypothetical protein
MSTAGRIMQLARQRTHRLRRLRHDHPAGREAPSFVDELFRIIHAAGGRKIDRSVHLGYSLGPSDDFVEWFSREIYSLGADMTGKEWQLWQIEKRGLCLVLAWITEIIGAKAATLA